MPDIQPQISYLGSSVFHSITRVSSATELNVDETGKKPEIKILRTRPNAANVIRPYRPHRHVPRTLGQLRIALLLKEGIKSNSNIESFPDILNTNSEFKNLIWMKLGDNDQERYQALSKIYQEHGFIGPLDLLEKATQQKLENLNCPVEINQKVSELFKILKSKTHNLSGYLPKAYSLAAIQSVEIYKSIIQNSENSKHPKDLQIFFGDYSNLGNTNKHFAEIIKTLLCKSLELNHDDQKMQISIQNKTAEEKEAVINSLEKILFYSESQGKPLLIAKDWDILKKIIRQEPAPPFAEKHLLSSVYNNPRYVNKMLDSIAEQAGKRLTDMTGVLIATQVKKSLENFSKTNIIACGQGGDEISGIIPNPNIDPVRLTNTINRETAQLCYSLGLNYHTHGKYLEAIFNGLGLGLAIDSSENLKELSRQNNDSSLCSIIEKVYLAPSKEAAKILSGCVIPFNIEDILSKYTAQVTDEQGLPKENPFAGSNNPKQIEVIRQKLQNLKDLYTRNDENPELTGPRYIQHVKGELTIQDFLQDLESQLDLQGQIIKGDKDHPVVGDGDIHDFDIIKDIAQRLLIRATIGLNESKNYKRSDETQSLIEAEEKNNLSPNIIENYLISLQERYNSCVPSETSQDQDSLFPPIDIRSPSDPNRKLLFTTQVDRDLAALGIWLKTDFPEINPESKSQIENIIAPLIRLQEEQDPITQTPAGSNLTKMIELYGEDIQVMNRLYPDQQERLNAVKIGQVQYPNEPLALALNVLNLAAFNKHLSVNYADQFLQIISKKLTGILKEQGFPNAEKLIFHSGGAKFILLLPPYVNSEEQEVFYSGTELREKAKDIQKQFFEYIKNLNDVEIDKFIKINNPEDLSENKIKIFFESVTKILNTDIPDLLSLKKLDSDKSDEPETPFTIGELMSPKGNIQGTHLAIGAIRSIKTSQHDATSTLASLNEDVEEAENRIKSKLETGSYA